MNGSHRLPRRLSAEQLLDALTQATGVRENFRPRLGGPTVALPASGVRAGALPDKQLTAETLELFGRPRGETVCACERHEEASLTQALHLINGKSLADKLAAPSGRVMRWVQAKASDDALVDDLYLATLCRLPEPSERAAMIQHLQSAGADRAKAAQDALWALLNSREFLFNH